jgi:hypothetical protein
MSRSDGAKPGQALSYSSQPNAEEAWTQFADELTRCIANLDEDEFLIVDTKQSGYFVQFAGRGGFGIRAEAVSNAYLDDRRKLSEDACMKLLELGWNAPTNIPDHLEPGGHPPDGSPNYFLEIALPVPYKAVARLAVDTLQQIFGVMHPGGLRYKAFATGGVKIRFPNLPIARVDRFEDESRALTALSSLARGTA